MKTITDSGIVSQKSNNGHTQTLMIEEKNVLFRIIIHVESYDFQSYARLQVMNSDRKWTLLHSVIPKDYDLTNFYLPSPSVEKYKVIINDLKKVIKKTAPIISLTTKEV